MHFCSRYTKLMVAFALVLVAFVVLGLVVIEEAPRLGLVMLGLFGLMFLVNIYYVIDSYQRIIILNDDGLAIHRSFRTPLRIEWADIQSVSYSHLTWVIEIRRVVGSSANISFAMNGLGTLAWYLDRYAPGTITAQARRFLPIMGSDAAHS